MQRPDEQKRKQIIAAAVKRFGSRPFHEVKLEEIAADARIGKGTIYIYFKSKEDLYASIVREGLRELIDRLRERVEAEDVSASQALRLIVRELVSYAIHQPARFKLLRSGVAMPFDPAAADLRAELGKLVEATIRRGVRRGEFSDPHPELTAQFIPAAVRAAILWGPREISEEVLANHILRIIVGGLERREVRV